MSRHGFVKGRVAEFVVEEARKAIGMFTVSRLFVALGALLALAACADFPAGQSEAERRRMACEGWTGNPDDRACLNTFRRDLP